MNELKGYITISKRTTMDGQVVVITIKDKLSRTQFVEFKMSLQDFADAITGLGEVEGELSVRGLENVGKKKITEKRTVNSGVRSYDKNILKEWLLENCQEEGWIIDPYIGSQGSVVYENNSDAIINYSVYKYE